MALTDFAIIRKSLTTRALGTVVTVLSVAVAVALMTVLLTLREAGPSAFQRGTGNMHILVSADSSPMQSVLNAIFYTGVPQRALSEAKYQEIAGHPLVAFAIPVQQGDNFKGLPTLATTPEFFTQFEPVAGTPWAFAEGKAFATNNEVVLGAAAAQQTGAKIGDKLVVTHGTDAGGHQHEDNPFIVTGVLKPTGSAHDRALFMTITASWLMHADDKRHAAAAAAKPADDHDHSHEGHDHDHDHAHDHAGVEEPTPENLKPDEKLITGIYVRVKGRRGGDASVMIGPLFSELRKDPGLTVALPGSELRNLFTIIGSVDRILIAIAGVVLISSGVSIMLALYNSMDQRRRQIAVLRVLGCSQARVFWLVIIESFLIGLFGALAGVALGLAGLQVAALWLRQIFGIVINALPDPAATGVVSAITVALACIAGLVPAIMAYRTSVIRNLRPLG